MARPTLLESQDAPLSLQRSGNERQQAVPLLLTPTSESPAATLAPPSGQPPGPAPPPLMLRQLPAAAPGRTISTGASPATAPPLLHRPRSAVSEASPAPTVTLPQPPALLHVMHLAPLPERGQSLVPLRFAPLQQQPQQQVPPRSSSAPAVQPIIGPPPRAGGPGVLPILPLDVPAPCTAPPKPRNKGWLLQVLTHLRCRLQTKDFVPVTIAGSPAVSHVQRQPLLHRWLHVAGCKKIASAQSKVPDSTAVPS